MRLENTDSHRRGPDGRFTFHWNESDVEARPGETILGALIAAGHVQLRTTRFSHEPRGMFCGIGACYDCLVEVDGKPNRRACVEPARPGMRVGPGRPPDMCDAE